jgi:hypothetical protein
VDGIPLNLTLGFNKDTNALLKVIGPLQGATIFIWHIDAFGRYSSVNSSGQTEITPGQVWLRAKQTTNAHHGSVHVQTLLPGWYPGRTVYFYLCVKLYGTASMSNDTLQRRKFFCPTYLSAAIKESLRKRHQQCDIPCNR